jgi:hypothetical protein
VLASCETDAQRDDGGGPGLGSSAGSEATNGGPDDGGDDGGDADTTGAGDDRGGSGSPQFDVGDGDDPDGTDPPQPGCRGVDFLFVIDNSTSMDGEQAALVGAFDGFMQTIRDELDPGSDFHILVTDTDAWGECGPATCPAALCRDPLAGDYVCTQMFEACDRELGAGVVHPAGQFATNAPCDVWGGQRYIVAEEPDLGGTFSCIATVGTSGYSEEVPMEAMIAALAPGINGPGGCNEGFLRDDALLVITFISDDPWNVDSGDPQSWYDAVVAAKHGDPSGVVVLGMTPNWPGCRAGDGNVRGKHWAEFIALWGEHGLHGNVCSTAENYVEFFDAAVSPIAEACEGFDPPG